jgi:hypothetical protein
MYEGRSDRVGVPVHQQLQEDRIMNSKCCRILAALAFASALAMMVTPSALAQCSQGLRIGILGGVNFNYVDAPTQQFVQVPGNAAFAGHDFSKAYLFDGYFGLSAEYQFTDLIGATHRTTYDARCVSKEDNGSKFTPQIVYVSIEPAVRLNLGMPELHALLGGTVAVKAHTEYDYSPHESEVMREVKGADLANVRDVAFGAWGGFGYDVRLPDMAPGIGWYMTPFLEASYLFDQKKPDVPMQDDRWWNTLTVRGGIRLCAEF